MRRHPLSKFQRGANLVVSMGFITVLTMMGTLAMRSIMFDVRTAGSERSSEDALNIAEAGLEQAKLNMTENYLSGNLVDYNSLFNGDGDNDPPEASTETRCDEAKVNAAGFKVIAAEDYSTGYFCAVVTDDDFREIANYPTPGAANGNNQIILRSLGVARGGHQASH